VGRTVSDAVGTRFVARSVRHPHGPDRSAVSRCETGNEETDQPFAGGGGRATSWQTGSRRGVAGGDARLDGHTVTPAASSTVRAVAERPDQGAPSIRARASASGLPWMTDGDTRLLSRYVFQTNLVPSRS